MGRAWMPLYVGDYLRDTRDLNTLQHGAYLLLIMHYWQHAALPRDEARLAAIAGLSVSQWRRIREPVAAKFADGWKHKRIEAELAKIERATMQRRLAGRSGGVKSGIARAVAQGEAIIRAQARAQVRAQAQAKRALPRRSSEGEAEGETGAKPPRTNHNQRIDSFFSCAPDAAGEADHKRSDQKPASQWSRQELEALFARRSAAAAEPPAADTRASDAPCAPDSPPEPNGD
jgi:uncharacterized protein YdaU (DUF1376 family)